MHDLKLLDASYIHHQLEQVFADRRFTLNVLPIIDSTNGYLLEKNSEQVHICLAEQQTAGRGRQGKNWVSPFGVNLYCSVLWPFKQSITKLAGLSLMVGVIVAKTLEGYGVTNIGLKWPNDIHIKPNKKIAGILIESTSEYTNLNKIVIGIGLNVFLSKILNQHDSTINQPWTDVVSNVSFLPNRTQLATYLLKDLLTALPLFEENGFGIFQVEWQNKDMLLNQPVTLQVNGKTIKGIGRGVDTTGRLIVENKQVLHYFNSVEIQ